MNTTNITLAATPSYQASAYKTSATSYPTGPIQTDNVGYVFGKVIRSGLGQLVESFQNFWKRKPSAEEIAYRRQGDVYLIGLRGFVERLDTALVNIERNPNDPQTLRRVEKLASEHSQFIKLHERQELRGQQEKLFKGLTQRFSRIKPRLQEKLETLLPIVFKNMREQQKSGKKIDQASSHERKNSFRDIQNERAKRNPDTAECQQSFDLQQLSPNDGAAIEGDMPDVGFGQSISPVGDINNDGKQDFAIGLPNANPNGITQAGQVIFIYGGQNFSSIDISKFSSANGLIINGQVTYDGFGSTIVLVGDINDDGKPDVAISAPVLPNGPGAQYGKLYVLFPPISNPTDLANLNGSNGFMMQGEGFNDYFGTCATGGGDLNGDTIDDMAVGSPSIYVNGSQVGAFYVLFGRPNSIPWPAQFNLTQLNGSNGFTGSGAGTNSYLGCPMSMATANGGALADFSVANSGISQAGLTYSGTLYTLHGQNGPWPSQVNLNLNGSNGFIAYGATDDSIATSVLVNGGKGNFPYLVIGADNANANSNLGAGKIYLLFKQPNSATTQINLATMNSTTGMEVDGPSSEGLGSSIASIDINNDGYTDLAMGIVGYSPGGTGIGQVVVALGQANGLPPQIDLAVLSSFNGFSINGTTKRAGLGQVVTNLGDINGNGIDALGISAPGVGNGTVYILNGWNAAQCPPPTTTPISTTPGPSTASPTASSATTNTASPTTLSATTSTSSPPTSSSTTQPPSSGKSLDVKTLAIALGVGIAFLIGLVVAATVYLRFKKKACFSEDGQPEPARHDAQDLYKDL